jgi:hypothetical protein
VDFLRDPHMVIESIPAGLFIPIDVRYPTVNANHLFLRLQAWTLAAEIRQDHGMDILALLYGYDLDSISPLHVRPEELASQTICRRYIRPLHTIHNSLIHEINAHSPSLITSLSPHSTSSPTPAFSRSFSPHLENQSPCPPQDSQASSCHLVSLSLLSLYSVAFSLWRKLAKSATLPARESEKHSFPSSPSQHPQLSLCSTRVDGLGVRMTK